MKKIILYIIAVLCFSFVSLRALGTNYITYYETPSVSPIEVIYDTGYNTSDNRDNTFPFSIHFDLQSNSLIITYDQERPAELDLTNVNGAIISHQSISGSGIFTMPLPSVSGTFYLFMTTPTILAYVTITL